MGFSGTLSAISSALDGLTYKPTASFTGSAASVAASPTISVIRAAEGP